MSKITKTCELIDIECYSRLFFLGIHDIVNNKKYSIEISEKINQLEEYIKWYESKKTIKNSHYDFVVSFNGISYDQIVMNFLYNNREKFKHFDGLSICKELKDMSDHIIWASKNEVFNDSLIKQHKYSHKWTPIDLFLFWAKLLRVSKKISLKGLAVQLDYPEIQELPYDPSTELNQEQIEVVKQYNLKNDLGILKVLFDRLQPEIKLRQKISFDYDINAWSMDAPKIASEVLLLDYCAKTSQDVKEIRNTRYSKDSILLGDILSDFNPKFETKIFQGLYERILNSTNDFSEELIVKQGKTVIKLSYGIGGLHSCEENIIHTSTNTHKIKTSDVASLYPNLIINYKCIRFDEVLERYINIKHERIEAKRNKELIKDTFYKLILNGISGIIDNSHSWLYYPEGALRLRIIGQMILTKAVESCILCGWQVTSTNTDGIDCIIPIEDEESYKRVINKVGDEFNLEFEHDGYKKIVFKNVNNYIALTDNGKIKRKGLFKLKEEIPLGDSTNELIIANLLTEYFLNNKNPWDILNNLNSTNYHIYNFCRANKISKQYNVYYNSTITQNLNRYYASNKGAYLYKKKKGIQRDYEHVLKDSGITLFNKYEEKPLELYDINTKYYYRKTMEIINEISPIQLQLL